jgi:hypothetical protein
VCAFQLRSDMRGHPPPNLLVRGGARARGGVALVDLPTMSTGQVTGWEPRKPSDEFVQAHLGVGIAELDGNVALQLVFEAHSLEENQLLNVAGRVARLFAAHLHTRERLHHR